MAPILWDAVEYAHRVRPWCKILIYSNGMYLTEDTIRKALKSRLTELNVSLDGGTVDIYKKVRRGGNLDLISENIKLFLKLRRESGKRFPRLGLNFVMVNDNEGDLPAFIQLAADLGVDYINCVTYATYDWGFRNSRTLENYRKELAEAKEVLDRTGLEGRYFQEWNSEWLKKDRKFGCNFFWGEEFRVSFSGYVTLGCCAPFPETYSYGNLFEQSFKEIWNCDKIRLNRRMANEGQIANSVCEACDTYAREFFDKNTDDTNEVKN